MIWSGIQRFPLPLFTHAHVEAARNQLGVVAWDLLAAVELELVPPAQFLFGPLLNPYLSGAHNRDRLPARGVR